MTANWTKKTLDELVESTLIGLVKNKSEQDDNKAFIYIKMHNITADNKLDTSKVVRVDALAEEVEKYKLSEGDFLFNTRNSHELVGKSCIFSMQKMQPILFNNNIMRIRFTLEVDSKFIAYSFSSQYISEQLESIKNGTTNVSAIYYSSLKNVAITYPHLPEQKRIVAILDEAFEGIDRAITNTEKNLANTRELFESYLNAIFTQKDNGWEWVSLSEITTDITDGDHQPPPKSELGIPFITISNINKHNRQVDFSNTFKVSHEYFEKLKINRKPRKGDLLYTVTGSYGIPVIVDHDIDFCFQRHIGLIRPNSETNSKCLYYILLSRYLLNQADKCATGAAQKTVSLSGLRRFSVPKIPKQKQEIIVAQLDNLSEQIARLETIYSKKLVALKELKQSIMQKAFTGELTADTPKTVKEKIAA